MKFELSLVLACACVTGHVLVPCKQPSAPGCTEPYLSGNSSVEWIAYQKAFNKSYPTLAEASSRYTVWLKNSLEMIHLNHENATFSFGWTVHSDMTLEEFRATRLGYRRNVVSNSTGKMGFSYLGEYGFDGNLSDLPSDVDWSSTSVEVVTPVKDQGNCGSCWSFSTTGSLEGALAVGNGWTKPMSEQQLLDCDKNDGSGCQGGDEDGALAWEKSQNVCSEASYGYSSGSGGSGSCRSQSCTTVITLGSIWGEYSVKANEDSVCSALVQRPLSIGIATGGGFMNYNSGIFSSLCGSNVDHAVLLVGYGYWNGNPYWKVKNSWGTRWGLNGYVLFKRGGPGAQECSILSDVGGVYVYGPYNPTLQLRGLNGDIVTSPDQNIVV